MVIDDVLIRLAGRLGHAGNVHTWTDAQAATVAALVQGQRHGGGCPAVAKRLLHHLRFLDNSPRRSRTTRTTVRCLSTVTAYQENRGGRSVLRKTVAHGDDELTVEG
jgi:hypothetical protein